jgi:hypothetical protein
MLVSELPESTNLMLVRVILPDDVLEKYVNYLGGEKEMYVVGSFMGDWFMSPTPSSKEERRLYPMPVSVLKLLISWMLSIKFLKIFKFQNP